MSATDRSKVDAPDVARHPTKRTPRERATGRQGEERQAAGERDAAARFAGIERETREQTRRAAQVEADARRPRPFVLARGRPSVPGPAGGRTNHPG
jgi:hypothetical protein